jgi:hypothetical protein
VGDRFFRLEEGRIRQVQSARNCNEARADFFQLLSFALVKDEAAACVIRERDNGAECSLHEINMKNDATLPLVVSANIQEKQTEQHSVERAGERKTARERERARRENALAAECSAQ